MVVACGSRLIHDTCIFHLNQAVASEDAFLREDDADDEADEREEQAEALAAKPKPLEQGGGMYFWERVSLGFQQLKRRLQARSPPEQPKKA